MKTVNNQPKVSVIIPCRITRPEQFNHLQEAIDSVKNQTLSALEIILIEDRIDTLISADFFDAYVSFKKENKDENIYSYSTALAGMSGVADARNLGISKAKGDYILCLDHDDILAPTAIEKMSNELDKSEFDIIGSWYTIFWDNSHKKDKVVKTNTNSDLFLIDHGIAITSMFKKEDWLRCGGFNNEFHDGIEDAEFFMRMIRVNNCKITVLQESLFFYRRYINYKSRHHSLSKERIETLIEKMNTDNIDLFERKALFLAKKARYYLIIAGDNNALKKKIKRIRNRTKLLVFSLVMSVATIAIILLKK